MTAGLLVLRGLSYYWRTNLAVVLGVATAVAVLAGALLVGDSVRGSLRDLVLQRIGRTDLAVLSTGFFREQLGEDLRSDRVFATRFAGLAPLVVTQGFATAQESGRRVGRVAVYGVDDRFWSFHGVDGAQGPGERDAFMSPALAAELAVGEGDAVLVRVQKPSAVPLESLHGRKDDLGRTLRLTVRQVLPRAGLGEFSLQPQQGDVRAVFVSLARLQEDLEIVGRANALLVSMTAQAIDGQDSGGSARADLEGLLRGRMALDDVGLRVRTVASGRAVAVESGAGVLDDSQTAAAQAAVAGAGLRAQPAFTYLANTIRSGPREVPYSLIAALDLATIAPGLQDDPASPLPPLLLNEWAARDLQAAVGAAVTLEYYVWAEPGRLVPRSADFRLAGVVPTEAGDRDLAPPYPGITDSPTVDAWDPPFPIDLRRVRPTDEAYWETYRTTPKVFIPLEVGQRLWRSRYGALTSIRALPPAGQAPEAARQQVADRLRADIDPLASGLAVREVRRDALDASRGATDFGQYFVYFSFFLVVSALLLASLFFKLGVEQRAREVGLLRAVGFRTAQVRRLLMVEGLALSVVGSLIGVGGALAYAWVMVYGLRTWWVGAVGTTAIEVHVSPLSLAGGAAGGVAAALVWIWWSLRALARITERSLLAGELSGAAAGSTQTRAGRRPLRLSVAAAVTGAALIGAGVLELVGRAGAFFGAGGALLVASMALFAHVCRRPRAGLVSGRGWTSVSSLGLRSATYRPARSVLSMAVIASATFILISVDSFRRDEGASSADPQSGTGGYELMVESLLPVLYDLSTVEGREALNLGALDALAVEPFRVLPGDDASCLNLYEPRHPRILGAREQFIAAGRFGFQSSLAATDAERANPWLLLGRSEPDGAVPVVADANSLTYVLHRALGDDIVIDDGGQPVTLRVVAVLRDSVFQSELLMSEANFRRLYADEEGYRFLLVDTPDGQAAATQTTVEEALADFGADATPTVDRLAEFHRVENTYLSTFQALGGLGLLLGTVGLAAVLLRNILERRRELALLGAVGYRRGHFLIMIVAENALLVGCGLLAGAVCALLAISPAAVERGSRLPLSSGGTLLLFGVALTGVLSSVIATRAAVRGSLLQSLRSE